MAGSTRGPPRNGPCRLSTAPWRPRHSDRSLYRHCAGARLAHRECPWNRLWPLPRLGPRGGRALGGRVRPRRLCLRPARPQSDEGAWWIGLHRGRGGRLRGWRWHARVAPEPPAKTNPESPSLYATASPKWLMRPVRGLGSAKQTLIHGTSKSTTWWSSSSENFSHTGCYQHDLPPKSSSTAEVRRLSQSLCTEVRYSVTCTPVLPTMLATVATSSEGSTGFET